MNNYYSIPSVFGGSDYFDESGNDVAYSVKSAFGGEDIYTSDNMTISTFESPFGGVDIAGDINGYSAPDQICGQDIFTDAGTGYSVPSAFGGNDYSFGD